MKNRMAYPIVVMKNPNTQEGGYLVNIPDFESYTFGDSFADAIAMARDAIGAAGISMQDEGVQLPEPDSKAPDPDYSGITTYVDIDFDDYRKKNDTHAVKKNCTIPYNLCKQAEDAGINFSRTLQDALIEKLNA